MAYMENDTEIIDSPNDTETMESEETIEAELKRLETTNPRLSARLKLAQEQNRELYNLVKTEEALLKENRKSSLKTKPSEVDDEIVSDVKSLKLAEKKRQFGYKHSLSPEETDRLFRYAADADPEEALKDPFFQAGLKEFRREKRVKEAIPSSSNRSAKVDGKTFSEMTSEERAKNWNKMFKK